MTNSPIWRWSGRLLVAGLFVFALYSNVLAFVRNKALGDRLVSAQAEVAKIEQRNYRLRLLPTYYQTQSYQETEARRRLGLKKPDESAVVIKGVSAGADTDPLANQDLFEVIRPTVPLPSSNISLWWQYFFGK